MELIIISYIFIQIIEYLIITQIINVFFERYS